MVVFLQEQSLSLMCLWSRAGCYTCKAVVIRFSIYSDLMRCFFAYFVFVLFRVFNLNAASNLRRLSRNYKHFSFVYRFFILLLVHVRLVCTKLGNIADKTFSYHVDLPFTLIDEVVPYLSYNAHPDRCEFKLLQIRSLSRNNLFVCSQ